jgi:CDP-paratose 2-epimerase
MATALVTGSGGLIGSQCVKTLCEAGWEVVGLDNNLRAWFFGPDSTTRPVVDSLIRDLRDYRHRDLDIRDRQAVRDLFRETRPDLIIHAAAQPSHDKAASIPYDDFDVNAGGTLNLLVAAHDFAPESPFCFLSTNKVYGDAPNRLPLVERDTRWDYDDRDGIDESLSIDQCLHSLFGASKTAADVLCQEYGRYFHMPVGIFRGGCLTGPDHAAVELHGYLNYIVRCAVTGRPYTIFGYGGKQVRDQIHAYDVAQLMLAFARDPRCGEVYNMGGGRENSISVVETINALSDRGLRLTYRYDDRARSGDHICYISDLRKIRTHFPGWRLTYDLPRMLDEIVARHERTNTGALEKLPA